MHKVLTAQHAAEAHMVRDFLGSNGIEAQIRNELLSGAVGEIPVHEASPTVWVDNEDAAKSEALVEKFFKDAAENQGEPWTCPTCGEFHEGQFTSCWSCNTERP